VLGGGAGPVRVVDHVHGGLLGRRGAVVDADVGAERLVVLVGAEALVLGDQAARTRVLVVAAAGQLVLVGVGVVLVGADVGLLLGEALVEGLALRLLGRRGAEPVGARPAVGRLVAHVERLTGGVVLEGVRRVEQAGVLLRARPVVVNLITVGHRLSRVDLGLYAPHNLAPTPRSHVTRPGRSLGKQGGQDLCVVVLGVVYPVQKCDHRMAGEFLAEPVDLGVVLQFGVVAPAELGELARVGVEPGAQLGAGRDFFGPESERRPLFGDAARPQPIDQHPESVAVVGVVVDALDLDVHPDIVAAAGSSTTDAAGRNVPDRKCGARNGSDDTV
jgi:hypothetical protein